MGTLSLFSADEINGKVSANSSDSPPSSGLFSSDEIAKAGGPNGETTNPVTGSKIIVPKEGESFLDTMKRAAQHGKTVSDAEVQASARQGLKDAPLVAAAAPAIGFGGAAALGAAGSTPQATKASIDAITKMAAAHPAAAALVKRALQAVGAGAAIKHRQWLLDLLP
jgi:hypothetical protein